MQGDHAMMRKPWNKRERHCVCSARGVKAHGYSAMAVKKVTEDQFVSQGNAVLHLPTNAIFFVLPGTPDLHQPLVSELDRVLPNGDQYKLRDVEPIARKLLKPTARKLLNKVSIKKQSVG
jgi:hypothetical protein